MFTGIIQGVAHIQTISTGSNFKSFILRFPENSLENIKKGASIAINGTCLTVTSFNIKENTAAFDVIQETLRVTNLNQLNEGNTVNFERAAKFGDEIGGHLMSGHIHSTVNVTRIVKTQDNCSIYFATPTKYKPYLLPKGFAGLNGCSLTLGEVNTEEFSVHLIPETLAVTTFGNIKINNQVNLEIDSQTQSIVDTVERILKTRE
jgi:riboflavin synthase